MGIHHFETSTTASWKRSLDRKPPLGYHSNSYSWKGKERTPPFGQTARVYTGKQTNLGFSEGILPRQLEFSFFDGEVNVNFEWFTFSALGRRTGPRFKILPSTYRPYVVSTKNRHVVLPSRRVPEIWNHSPFIKSSIPGSSKSRCSRKQTKPSLSTTLL